MSGYIIGVGTGQSSSIAPGRKAYTMISVDGGTAISDTSAVILPASTNQDVLDGLVPRFMSISIPENQSDFYIALGEDVVLTPGSEIYFRKVPKGLEFEFMVTGQAVYAACVSGSTSKAMIWESV